jgi:ketoreductase
MNQKTAIISGAGSGIGRAIAIQLAAQGWKLILSGRKIQNLQATAAMLQNEPLHKAIAADVCDKNSLQQAFEQIKNEKLHAIIANAGLGGPNSWGTDDRWSAIIDTNLNGSYNFVRSFQPLLSDDVSESRHILFISSVLARLGVEGYTAYCASKAGLLGLMRSMAIELAPENILVNAICPGWVNTNMAREGMQGLADENGMRVEEFHELAMQSVPLRKMSEPSEIGALCAYLVNQQSITGQTIDINNGSVMNS